MDYNIYAKYMWMFQHGDIESIDVTCSHLLAGVEVGGDAYHAEHRIALHHPRLNTGLMVHITMAH